MPLNLKEAYDAALKAYPAGCGIIEAYDGASHWIFTMTDGKGFVIPGGSPAFVSKESGDVDLLVPSVPYRASGAAPTDGEIELEEAREVPLPV